MRLFVLDESPLLAWTVEHLAPPGTEVTGFTSFEEARRSMLQRAPDAFVVAVTSAHHPWRELSALCAAHTPPLPVLCVSPLYATAEEAGLEPADGAVVFLHTPAPVAVVAKSIAAVLDLASAALSPLVDAAAAPLPA